MGVCGLAARGLCLTGELNRERKCCARFFFAFGHHLHCRLVDECICGDFLGALEGVRGLVLVLVLSPDIGEISDWFLVGLLLPAMVRVLEPGFVFCPEAEADWFLVGLRLPAMVPVLVPGFELCSEGKVTISVSGAGGSVWISHQGHRHRPLVFPPLIPHRLSTNCRGTRVFW